MLYRPIPFVVMLFCFVTPYAHAAQVVKGNIDPFINQTFSVPMRPLVTPANRASVYTAANTAGAGEFAVSQLTRDGTEFCPLAFERVKINGVDALNPLFDKKIIAFSVMETSRDSAVAGMLERPIAVSDDEKATLYLVNTFSKKSAQLSSAMLTDAAGAVTDEIVGLATSPAYAFGAVKASGGGTFGDVGSGIAPVVLGATNVAVFQQTDAATGSLGGTISAAPLDRIQGIVNGFGADLTAMDFADMHWHPFLGKLYVAISGTSAGAGTDIISAVVVGEFGANGQFTLKEIVHPAALGGVADGIIVGGAGQQITLHKIRPMGTSTLLNYLIVVGGNGAPAQNSVSAIPLTQDGVIAKKDSDITEMFGTVGRNKWLTHRAFTEFAQTPADLPRTTDTAAQVGGAVVPFGDVADVFVHGDAVFVSVQTAAGNNFPGVFFSQALFDDQGRIKGWTAWQRTYGFTADDKIGSAVIDPVHGDVIMLQANAMGSLVIAKRTDWGTDADPGTGRLVQHIGTELGGEFGGVQGLFDFPQQTPGFDNVSLLVATGTRKILLAETGSTPADFVPNSGADFDDIERFIQGAIDQTFPVGTTKVITVEGGVLDDIGPINAAAIGCDGTSNHGYLFVGGSHGVAVLSKANGDGWDAATKLTTGFDGLTNDMTFKMVGEYAGVRKLVTQRDFLYVVTDTQIDRINLGDVNAGLGTAPATTVALIDNVIGRSNGAFFDMISSDCFALITTTHGMYRIGNGKSVCTVVDTTDAQWTSVFTPERPGPIARLIPMSPDNLTENIAARRDGGQVYLLHSYGGKNQAQINRFAVKNICPNGINDETVLPFPDKFVPDDLSYWTNFGASKNSFGTDGGRNFVGNQVDLGRPASIRTFLATPGARTGIRFSGITGPVVPSGIPNSALISGIVRNSAAGSWMVGGDFGVRVNE